MKYKFIIILLLVFSSCLYSTIYYVDAEKGKDSFSGTSPEKAWKSIEKVNSMRFNPGDQILFKRGKKWTDMLVPPTSGTSSKRILFGAYGDGDKPILTTRQLLPGSNNKTQWNKCTNNIYSSHLKGVPIIGRIWLSNKEYESAKDSNSVNKKDRWHYNKNNITIYVYAESNPADFYSAIEIPGGINHEIFTINIDKKDYLTFKDLDLQGGYTGTIGLKNSSYVTFEDCIIGKYSHGRGIIGNQGVTKENKDKSGTSDHIIIRNNIIDSGWKVFAGYNRSIMDGISIQNGANFWEVYNNKFINWDHAAVQIYGIHTPVTYNKVYSNYVTAPDIAFSRAFETVGTDYNICSYNEFFKNRVCSTTARSQFGGTYNKIYYNIFEHMKNSTVPYGGHTTAQAITLAAVAGPSEYNMACNNTIYATGRDGIWDYGNNNIIVNNLIIDAGRENKGGSLRISKHVKGSTWHKNIIYVPGSSKGDLLVHYKEKNFTLHQFNALNGHSQNKLMENIQYTGSINDLVVDAASGNYTPLKNSPVVDSGIDMGFKEDYYGNPIINKPDIGAIEYTPESLGKK